MSPPSTREQAQPASAGSAGGLWAPQRRALTTGLVLTITFVASEALAVVTIMPVVARELGGLRLYGWVFSAFMLGSVFGIVAAGRLADRRGPAIPYVGGLVLFGAGLAIAGLAPAMLILVIGRALQGIGAGAIPAVAYAAIGRTLPGRLRARMMAVLSTAWVVPGVVGPALSAAVASLAGWRWVFLGLLPLVAVTGSFAIPSLLRLGAPGPGRLTARARPASARRAASPAVSTGCLTASAPPPGRPWCWPGSPRRAARGTCCSEFRCCWPAACWAGWCCAGCSRRARSGSGAGCRRLCSAAAC